MNNVREYKDSFLGERYYKIEHESGLSVLVFPKERQSSCAILATEFGSIDNRFYNGEGKLVRLPDGIAHFMEHKMFDNEGGENVDDLFSKLGGDPNAYTSWDHTGYVFTCNSGESFYKCLGHLIDFVTNPYFTEASVEKEQGIIGQEIAMCEDDPYDRCFCGMVKGLFENHPVRNEIVGSVESIAKITPELLYECHERFYDPANMALSVCGDVDVKRVLDVVDKHVKPRRAPTATKKYQYKERIGAYRKRVEQTMAVERPMFCIGFKDSKEPYDPVERRKREMLVDILIGVIFSSSNALYTSLFRRGIMTTPFNYGVEFGKTYGLCYVGGECDDVELLTDEVRKYIKKLKRNGINKDDFERRKKIIYSSDIKMYDSTWDIANALFDNAFGNVELFEETKLLQSITLEDANILLKELFRENNMTCSVVLPSAE